MEYNQSKRSETVKRSGEEALILNEHGYTLHWKGHDQNFHGVGFVVYKNIAQNVIKFNDAPERLASLIIAIDKNTSLQTFPVSAPSIPHDKKVLKMDKRNDPIETVYWGTYIRETFQKMGR